jgi:MinD-like ATPase involved in chromosome partitioning or flagellar assembly
MAERLMIVNGPKGGVGTTTGALNLAACLLAQPRRNETANAGSSANSAATASVSAVAK